MNRTLKALTAITVNTLMGGTIAYLLGATPIVGAIALNIIALITGAMPHSAACAGVYTEIWTGELVKSLRSGLQGTWLDGIPDQSTIVNNDTIHLVEVGIDPEVLVNNTTYPIPLQALDDKDIAISLDKFQTKVTPITDDELYAISYDKMARVKESHANAISDAKFAKAAHALCAQTDTDTTPIITTTGAADGDTKRKRMTIADLVSMKRSMDLLGVPTDNRRLVLCPDHVNDLLLSSQNFREQYNIDRATGKIGQLFGFTIYEYAATPIYTAALAKKAVGATADAGEYHASFAFYTPRVFKATGTTRMYYSEASTDPQHQRSLINFSHRFICMPKKADAGVVITSGTEA